MWHYGDMLSSRLFALAQSPACPERYNVADPAGQFTTLAELLATLAFTVLVLYLARQDIGVDPGQVDNKAVENVDLRRRDEVAASLFCAMIALIICTILYATLSGDCGSSRGILGLFVYGVLLGLSILALFYTLTLLAVDQLTLVSRVGYVGIVSIGPALVIRFTAPVASAAVDKGAGYATIRNIGWGIMLIYLLLTLWALARSAHRKDRQKSLQKKLHRLLPEKIRQTMAPPVFTFAMATLVGAFSIAITGQSDSFTPPKLLVWVLWMISVASLGFFSLVSTYIFLDVQLAANEGSSSSLTEEEHQDGGGKH